MHRFLFAVVLSAASASAVSTQPTIRDFLPGHSTVTEQGSKLRLVFERFTSNLSTITVNEEDLNDCTFEILYPTYGDPAKQGEETVVCRRVVVENDEVMEQGQPLDVTVFICHLDRDIHHADEIGSPIDLLVEGWGHNTNSSEVTGIVDDWTPDNDPGSDVEYPKPIISWDLVPHQMYDDQIDDGQFHIDLVAFHRYTYYDSPYGDYEVTIWINPTAAQQDGPPDPPLVTPQVVKTARPAFKAGARAGFPAMWVYRATFDATEFEDLLGPFTGELYVHFRVVPSRGDEQSVRTSEGYDDDHEWSASDEEQRQQPNVETMRITINNGGASIDAPWYASVDPVTGSDTNGDVYQDIEDARLDPFKTIYAAAQELVSANPGESIDNAFILLQEHGAAGGHRWGPTPTSRTAASVTGFDNVRWLTIMRDEENVPDRDDCVITNAMFWLQIADDSEALVTPVFEIEEKAGNYSYRWSGSDFIIRENEVPPVDFIFDRAGQTVADLVDWVDTTFTDLEASVIDSWNDIRVDGGAFDSTQFTNLPALQEFSANPYVHAASDGVHVLNGGDFNTFSVGSGVSAQQLVTNITTHADYSGIISGAIFRPLNTDILEIREPVSLKNNELPEWWEEARNDDGIGNRGYTKFEGITFRSISPKGAMGNDNELHSWFDKCRFFAETKGSNDSQNTTTLNATSSNWSGGIWVTNSDFDTMNKCNSYTAMVRDTAFDEIGGDSMKQVSYAANIIATNFTPVAEEQVHRDVFQWSPTELMLNENILAMNIDARENVDAQAWLFNSPSNEAGHTYKGIALVNYRWNNDSASQVSTSIGDHVLIWHCTGIQGESQDEERAIWLRGPSKQGQPSGRYTNVSVRNTVCEKLRLDAIDGDKGLGGDMPSLWSCIKFCHIVLQLNDETTQPPDSLPIDDYPGCQDGGELDDMMDFPDGDWDPNIVFIPPALTGHLAVEDILYRTDAGGKERFINDSGAIGAMEGPAGEPSENDTFDIATGTLSSGTLADTILSDNTYLVGQSTTSGSFTLDVIIDAITSVASPATINITVEASRSVAGGTANFRLKNWSTSNWDQVDSYSLGTTEIVRTKTGVTATNYVRAADGVIEFSFEVTGLVGIPTGFTASIDQIKIVVRE
jgi:hypothetical protein